VFVSTVRAGEPHVGFIGGCAVLLVLLALWQIVRSAIADAKAEGR
jgi:hypothetical protein